MYVCQCEARQLCVCVCVCMRSGMNKGVKGTKREASERVSFRGRYTFPSTLTLNQHTYFSTPPLSTSLHLSPLPSPLLSTPLLCLLFSALLCSSLLFSSLLFSPLLS